MRRLVYFIASTLDGFIAGPDGADPSGPDGFWPIPDDYLQHIITTYPETLPAAGRAALSVTAEGTHFDTVLEGRRSYEIGLRVDVTNAYPHLRHLVFSRTLTESPDQGVELVASDPVEKVRELKQEAGKDIWLCGGATLARTLYSEIDELIVKLSPLTIAAGIPLFSPDATFDPRSWALTDHTALPSGVLILTYGRPAPA